MRGLVLATLAVLIACSICEPILRFESERTLQLKKFEFANCLPTEEEKVVVNSLILKPDPLVFPGNLAVSFEVTFKEEVHSPVKAVVSVYRKVYSMWIKIPCIEDIGSCTYNDLCSKLSTITQCPKSFVTAGVPCHCPFKKGTYKLPFTTFDVDTPIMIDGEYRAEANLTMNDQILGCYKLNVTIVKPKL